MAKQTSGLVQQERKRWLFFGIPFTFTKYTITENKFILNEGFFTSTENEILLYRVLDITLKRTLWQKLFGLGSVIVQSQDQTHPTLVVKNIKHSVQFKEELSTHVEMEKVRLNMRRGEYIHSPGGHHHPGDIDDIDPNFDHGDIDHPDFDNDVN